MERKKKKQKQSSLGRDSIVQKGEMPHTSFGKTNLQERTAYLKKHSKWNTFSDELFQWYLLKNVATK